MSGFLSRYPSWMIAAVILLFSVAGAGIICKMVPPEKTFCARMYDAAETQCADDLSTQWSDQGGDIYSREQNVKDLAICHRISSAVENSCRERMKE